MDKIEQCVSLTATGNICVTNYGTLTIDKSDIVKAIFNDLKEEYATEYSGKEFYGEISIVVTTFPRKKLTVQSDVFGE